MKRREGDGRNSGQQVLDGEVRNDDLVLRNDARDAVFRDRFHGVKERKKRSWEDTRTRRGCQFMGLRPGNLRLGVVPLFCHSAQLRLCRYVDNMHLTALNTAVASRNCHGCLYRLGRLGVLKRPSSDRHTPYNSQPIQHVLKKLGI